MLAGASEQPLMADVLLWPTTTRRPRRWGPWRRCSPSSPRPTSTSTCRASTWVRCTRRTCCVQTWWTRRVSAARGGRAQEFARDMGVMWGW